MKNSLLIMAIAILALTAGVFSRLQTGDKVASPEPALSFVFPDIDGKLQSVSQWQGKILVINFWASWCGPCKQEIPEFIRLQQQYADKDVQFIGIAVDDRQPVLEFLQQVAINYPILIAGDAGSTLSSQLGNIIGVLPFTAVVNRQGQIVHRQPGEWTEKDFIEVVEPLLAEKSDKLR
jgi:thiol-disulfide isomerase/thioredoxin